MATIRTRPGGERFRGGKHRPGAAAQRQKAAASAASVSTADRRTTVAGPASAPRKPKNTLRRFFLWILGVSALIVGAFVGTLWYVYSHTHLPKVPPGAQTTFVYDVDGRLIARLHASVDRVEIPLSQMPLHLREAVIAVEDKNYYEHGAISLWGMARAAWADITQRKLVQGGSTITQQYVKNVYTGSERTVTRKIREALLAMKVDRKYSKNDILKRYLNTVYFGNGAYGVEAAARTYWDVHARELDLQQAATLAGLIRSPETYDPFDHPNRAVERRNLVLDLMAEQGYITTSGAARLKDAPLSLRARSETTQTRYGYFVDYVRRVVQDQFGYDEVFKGGLRVRTTLKSSWQQAAENAVSRYLPKKRDPSAALVAIDPHDGSIRAMVGGRDFNKVKLNLAWQAHRQAGSAFKPFTFAAAMEKRISPNSQWKGPPSITIPDPQCNNENGEPWEPHSYEDESFGTMSLLSATAYSVNTVYAQLVTVVGPEHVADVAHRAGIDSHLEPVCSITLGTQAVTPLEMASSYATFAARGVQHEPYSITQVRSRTGKLLAETDLEPDRALAQNDADLVTYALQGVVDHGTGVAADIGRPVAGKTGTSQEYRDAWFCGYVPQLTACVWVGYPKGEIPMHNVEGVPNVVGGTIPAAIWHDFMLKATAGMPALEFPKPSFQGYDVVPKPAFPSPQPTFTQPPQTTPPTTPPSTTPSPTTPPSRTPPPTTPPPTTPPSTTPPPTVPAPQSSPKGRAAALP